MIVVRFAVLLYLFAGIGGGDAAPPVQADRAQLWAGAPSDQDDSQSSDDDNGDDNDDDDVHPVGADATMVPSLVPVLLIAPAVSGRIIASSDAPPPSAFREPLFRPPRAPSA